mgnify:CR=1 FL=1
MLPGFLLDVGKALFGPIGQFFQGHDPQHAHNFKYSFRDQLLIFAQKPDATACAEISFWNRHGQWVNRGTSVGKALFGPIGQFFQGHDPQHPPPFTAVFLTRIKVLAKNSGAAIVGMCAKAAGAKFQLVCRRLVLPAKNIRPDNDPPFFLYIYFLLAERKTLFLFQSVIVLGDEKLDYSENRMVGDYRIIRSMYVGDKEIVFGEDMESPPGKRYASKKYIYRKNGGSFP